MVNVDGNRLDLDPFLARFISRGSKFLVIERENWVPGLSIGCVLLQRAKSDCDSNSCQQLT